MLRGNNPDVLFRLSSAPVLIISLLNSLAAKMASQSTRPICTVVWKLSVNHMLWEMINSCHGRCRGSMFSAYMIYRIAATVSTLIRQDSYATGTLTG